MTPAQALEIVNAAAAQARLSRADHLTVQQALDVLLAALTQPRP